MAFLLALNLDTDKHLSSTPHFKPCDCPCHGNLLFFDSFTSKCEARPIKKHYCISNWHSYFLVEASSPLEAIASKYNGTYLYIGDEILSDDTVVSVMCCEYKGYVEFV